MFYSNKDSYIDINQLIQSLVIFEYNKIEWINRRGSEQTLILVVSQSEEANCTKQRKRTKRFVGPGVGGVAEISCSITRSIGWTIPVLDR